MLSPRSYFAPVSADLYAFAIPENAAVGSTVGRIMAEDEDVGINAKMTYSLEDDLEESATFIIRTDPATQEGVVLLAKVGARLFILPRLTLFSFVFSSDVSKEAAKPGSARGRAKRPLGSEILSSVLRLALAVLLNCQIKDFSRIRNSSVK